MSSRRLSAISASAFGNPSTKSAIAYAPIATVKCWGYNAQGELGLGDVQNRGNDPGEMGDALPPAFVTF